MRTRQTVLVQPEAPRVIPTATAMSREAWATYYEAVWSARLDAHLHARYFARIRGWLGMASSALQLVTVVGSGSAFATAVGTFSGGDTIVKAATLVVAVAAGLLTVTGLAGRVQRASILEEAWAVRCAFWDDALVLVQDSKYIGTLSQLHAPEAALRRTEAELRLPQIRWYIARIQKQLMQTDPFARAQIA